MGNKQGKSYPRYKYASNGDGEALGVQSQEDFENRWAVFIKSLDVGPERIRQIEDLEHKQKMELLLNFESKNPKCSAFHYVTLIKGLRSGQVGTKKKDGIQNAKEVLSATEISLRTNNVDWVYDFLNHKGLDVLIDYISKTIYILLRFGELCGTTTLPRYRPGPYEAPGTPGGSAEARIARSRSLNRKTTRPVPPVTDAIKDSIHLGLKCFRTILNNQRGCALAFEHTDAINVVTLCLLHPSYHTKTLVLDLLSAVCLIVGGHDKVLKAFDNFKAVTGENRRFETMMHFFRHHETLSLEEYNIDFVVSCMQFINIVVHSVDYDINLRVYLQYELQLIGLDDFLRKLLERPGDRLNRQVDAYLSNCVDVSVLLEDSETKEVYATDVDRLERELAQAQDRQDRIDQETAARIAQFQQRMSALQAEVHAFRAKEEEQTTSMGLLQKRIKDMDRSASDREKDLEKQIQDLEERLKHANAAVTAAATTGGDNVDGALGALDAVLDDGSSEGSACATPVRTPLQPKTKLPLVNWSGLRSQQLKGTIFTGMNDLKVLEDLDLDGLEAVFSLGPSGEVNGVDASLTREAQGESRNKAQDRKSLVDAKRRKCLRQLVHYLEVFGLTMSTLERAVDEFSLSGVVADRLLPHLPTPEEAARYHNYQNVECLPVDQLTDEDCLLLRLCKIQRLGPRLQTIEYMAGFEDNIKNLQPKIRLITTASLSLRNSDKLKRVLEIILALGNYMNGTRRGVVHGFRLYSLDLLMETRSPDKKCTLVHFLARIMEEKYPDLLCYYDDLTSLEAAAKIPLEILLSDVSILCESMSQAVYELELCGANPPATLATFVRANESRAEALRAEADTAKALFLQSAEFFGEKHGTPSPDYVFGVLARFVDNFKVAVEENEKLGVHRASSSAKSDIPPKKKERKLTSEAKKQNRRKKNRTRQINADGIMDEIMAGLGSEPLQAGLHRRRDRGSTEELEET